MNQDTCQSIRMECLAKHQSCMTYSHIAVAVIVQTGNFVNAFYSDRKPMKRF